MTQHLLMNEHCKFNLLTIPISFSDMNADYIQQLINDELHFVWETTLLFTLNWNLSYDYIQKRFVLVKVMAWCNRQQFIAFTSDGA